jgi:hypothetical protein
MVAVLVVGTIIGLIWADTSNLAGGFAVVTNIVGVVGIALLAVAYAMTAVDGGASGEGGLGR